MVIYIFKYVRLNIAFGNLIANIDQQHDLQSIKQNKTGSVLTAMTYWYCCVFIVDMEKQ